MEPLPAALDAFMEFIAEKGLSLYDHQEEAILEVFADRSVILNTPTGSGKSLVATAFHFKSLSARRRSVYTSPIKALVNEKFLALCQDFGPELVGLLTGDGGVNTDAPILCCTAEILANKALRMGESCDYDDVIMDEFHYYSDRDRGAAWQIPLLIMRQARFLLMSATMGRTEFFQEFITKHTGIATVTVKANQRPVPLEFEYSEFSIDIALNKLLDAGRAPVYVVHFTQRDAADTAQSLLSTDFLTKEQKQAIHRAMAQHRFDSPYGKEIRKLLAHGIGIHHAGLLPKYRMLVEHLAQEGLLKIICGTDTLGVGVNIPIRTVLLTKLCKFDGEKTARLTSRDFHQITGRAGRKGFDDRGWVVVQAPEHVIENKKLEAKAAGSQKKKFVRKPAPTKGYVHWDEDIFRKLVASEPEPLQSRFQVDHGMLLFVLGRKTNGCEAMKAIIRDSHESDVMKQRHRRRAFQLLRALLERKIIEWVPLDERVETPLKVNVNLQQDFSLFQTLSLYLIDTLGKLDFEAEDYPFHVLSLVEAVCEDPDAILFKQQDRIRRQELQAMKDAGLEYEERMELLEKIEYPKPNKDFIYDTFNVFSAAHPWIGSENIRPKGVARELFENWLSFGEFIQDYGIQRSEGLLLRYLSSVYKVLHQTVPEIFQTEALLEMKEYFGSMVREVDSSLLDEWERLRKRGYGQALSSVESATVPVALVSDDRLRFRVLVRNAGFAILRAIAIRDFAGALSMLEGCTLAPEELAQTIAPWFERHPRLSTDGRARGTKNFVLKAHGPREWDLQILLVPGGHEDLDGDEADPWFLDLKVDFNQSDIQGKAVLRLVGLGPAVQS